MTNLIEHYNSLNKVLDKKLRRKICRDYMTWLKDTWYWLPPPHHVLTPNNHGTGMKPCDLYCIPVDAETHRKMQSYEISLDEQLEILKMTHKSYKGL